VAAMDEHRSDGDASLVESGASLFDSHAQETMIHASARLLIFPSQPTIVSASKDADQPPQPRSASGDWPFFTARLRHDVNNLLYASIADEDMRAGHELVHVGLASSAKRTS